MPGTGHNGFPDFCLPLSRRCLFRRSAGVLTGSASCRYPGSSGTAPSARDKELSSFRTGAVHMPHRCLKLIILIPGVVLIVTGCASAAPVPSVTHAASHAVSSRPVPSATHPVTHAASHAVSSSPVTVVPVSSSPVTAPEPSRVPVAASPAVSCYPLTGSGHCYQPGEYCRTTDHGMSGIAEDGQDITCENDDGWRWEP
jgi:hypothetical protein